MIWWFWYNSNIINLYFTILVCLLIPYSSFIWNSLQLLFTACITTMVVVLYTLATLKWLKQKQEFLHQLLLKGILAWSKLFLEHQNKKTKQKKLLHRKVVCSLKVEQRSHLWGPKQKIRDSLCCPCLCLAALSRLSQSAEQKEGDMSEKVFSYGRVSFSLLFW